MWGNGRNQSADMESKFSMKPRWSQVKIRSRICEVILLKITLRKLFLVNALSDIITQRTNAHRMSYKRRARDEN